MWKRAVWREGNYEEEGVVPAIWIKAGSLFWPPGANAERAFNEKRKPTDKWRQFPLVKIKHSSDSFKDCDQYNQTTSAELSEEDEQPAKRKSAKRKYDGLVSTHSVNDSEEDINENVPGSSGKQKCPTPPKKISRVGHQSKISPKKKTTGNINYSDELHNFTQPQGDSKSDENCTAMLNQADGGKSKSQLQDEPARKNTTESTENDNRSISTCNKIKKSVAREKSPPNRNKSPMKNMSISAQTSRKMSQKQSRSRSPSENYQQSLGASTFSSGQKITTSKASKSPSMVYQSDSQERYRSRSPEHLSQASTSSICWVTPIKHITGSQGNSNTNTPSVGHDSFSRGSSTTRTELSSIQHQQRCPERLRSRSPVGHQLISQANSCSISLFSPIQHITNSEKRSRSRSSPAQNHPSSHGATSSCSISSPIQRKKSFQRSPAGNRSHSRERSSSRSVNSPIVHHHGSQNRYRSRSPTARHHQSYWGSPISRSLVSPFRHQSRFLSTSTPLGHRSHSWENSRSVRSPIHYQRSSQERFRSKSPPSRHQQRSPSSTISKVVMRDRFPMSDEKFQKRVLYGLCELKQLILRFGVSMDPGEENVIHRCSSLDDLRQMETSLQNPDDRCQLIAKCVRVGGVDVKDMVGNILDRLERLMTNEVMAEFNMKGQRGKFAFENTAIFKVVTAAVLKGNKTTATECETAKCIGRYLKYAPDRKKGGRRQQD